MIELKNQCFLNVTLTCLFSSLCKSVSRIVFNIPICGPPYRGYCIASKITPDFNINASREVTLLVLSKSDYIHSLLYSSKLNM